MPIFEGVTFALMGMKEGNRESVRRGIESRGGVVRVDEGAEGRLGECDWVCVEYFG